MQLNRSTNIVAMMADAVDSIDLAFGKNDSTSVEDSLKFLENLIAVARSMAKNGSYT